GLFSDVADRIRLVQSSWRFRSRRCMNFANAIRPKTNRHSTTNRTMLFVGVGRFSGKRAVGSIGDVVIVARNVLNRRRLRRDGQILPLLWRIALGLGLR